MASTDKIQMPSKEKANSARVTKYEDAWAAVRRLLMKRNSRISSAPPAMTITLGEARKGAGNPDGPRAGECNMGLKPKGEGSSQLGWSGLGGRVIAIPARFADSWVQVMTYLAHMMVHTATTDGHGKGFAALADSVGLVSPHTMPKASADLESSFKLLAVQLGPLPAGRNVGKAQAKRATYLRKYVCGGNADESLKCPVIRVSDGSRPEADRFHNIIGKCGRCGTAFTDATP